MKHSEPGSIRTDTLSTPSENDRADQTPRTRRAGRPAPEFVERARSSLTTQYIGRAMRAYAVVNSTNTLAAEWLSEGAPDGSVVVADYQTHGRGRLGRSWTARQGLNLTFSVILRPSLPPDRIGMLTIAACVGVARAVDHFADPIRTSIKWPNDIYLSGRKVCGMLLEASWSGGAAKPAVILGIGLNVNQDSFPEEIRGRATSLLLETGRMTPRADLFSAVLSSLEEEMARLPDGEDVIRRDYRDRMIRLDERISLRFAETQRIVEGVVRGIDTGGGVILEMDSGRHVFHAGEVTCDL